MSLSAIDVNFVVIVVQIIPLTLRSAKLTNLRRQIHWRSQQIVGSGRRGRRSGGRGRRSGSRRVRARHGGGWCVLVFI